MPIALSFGILALPGGSASDVSLVLGVQLAPTITFMIFGGVAGDRFKRNQLVGGSDVIGSLFVFLSAASFIFGFTSIALLCVTGFIFGVLNAFWWPALAPIGLVIIGPIIEAIGVVQTSRLLALMTVVAVITPITFREVRNLRNAA